MAKPAGLARSPASQVSQVANIRYQAIANGASFPTVPRTDEGVACGPLVGRGQSAQPTTATVKRTTTR